MSFASSAFGAFGQNNNNNNNNPQPSAFGSFGSNTAATGFGASNTGGFGQNNSPGGGMFGNTNATNSGFGAPASGGFGSNAGTGGFGSKPAFGSASGSVFGSAANNNNPTNTATFGTFGSNPNAAASSPSPFAAVGNASGGLFANKSGFGSSTNTGGSVFGSGATNTGGFGAASTGFGAAGALSDPPGTASTPFAAYTEKEPSGSATNSFQNITFQEPYRKWSAEELRLVDYAQGRRHGNATGGGAFGVSSGFGGFGSTSLTPQNNSAFGANNTNTTGGGLFGNNANNTAAAGSSFGGSTFGANTQNNTAGGGLFGSANKPAGGLFGSNTQPQQSAGSVFGGGSGGFGAATNAFGANNTNNNAGGGLFGNSANKTGTGFGGFGSANNTTANTGSAFGGNSPSPFAALANNNGSSVFGANNNNQSTGGGLFGNNNQNQQQQNPGTGFGSAFGGQQNQQQQTAGGLFGNQDKPTTAGGLFGASTNNASGFGANNTQEQQNTGGGAFGNTNTSSPSSFFGSKQPAMGGGMFSIGNAAQPASGSSLFGANNQQQQPQQGGGLFGSGNNQQTSPSPFAALAQPGNSVFGSFGGQNNQASSGGGLFGSSMNQQQNQNAMGNSLLGSTQQNNNAPQGLTANLNDVSAYGSPSLFAGLGGNEVSNPGPLATPLHGNSKPRKSSILPMYKLAPATAASRFATPQKRGFGFSYSSYGTPGGSPASSISSPPGNMGRSLLGSSSTGSLNKSFSASNLRRSFNTEDSILAPGAFSSGSNTRWYGSTGSKKLVINRDIRSDLFSTPQKDKTDANGSARKLSKRVSFDTNTVEPDEGTPVLQALPAPDDSPNSQLDETTPRQNRNLKGANASQNPEMEQVRGNELAIVHEEDSSATPEVQALVGFDNAPGEYWMQPTRDELQNMNRMQRQRVDNFTVGREHVGYVKFKVPVDMSSIELDDLCGGIIQLEPRSATVYPVQAKKPPVGKGLNVPAQISLEQSWPRGGRNKRVASDPKRFNKHVEKLKRIPDTTFESYDKDTGIWTFSVEHFTTYGLDDSDEDSDDDMVSQPTIDTPTRPVHPIGPKSAMADGPAEDSSAADGIKQNTLFPGAFDENEELYDLKNTEEESFLGNSSADSAPNDVRLSLDDDYTDETGDEYDMSEDEDMTKSSPGQHLAAELDDASSENEQDPQRDTPGGILRARMRAVKESIGPIALEVADGDDWMEMLRKTVSPVKRDRQLLREMNDSPIKFLGGLDDMDENVGHNLRKSSIWGRSPSKGDAASGPAGAREMLTKGRGFATSIDLMNSLFEKPKPKPTRQTLCASVSEAKGFPQWPYERQDKNLTVDEEEMAYHNASHPTWGPDETLVVTRSLGTTQFRRSLRDNTDILEFQRGGIQTERQDLRLAKFSAESSKKFLHAQDKVTEIKLVNDVPMAVLRAGSLLDVFHHQQMSAPTSAHEKRVWELASILFDGVPGVGFSEPEHLIRKEKLIRFWTELVEPASTTNIGLAGSHEEKAVASLAGHRVAEACKHLIDGKNFRLGTLVPLIGTSDAARKDMKDQLKAWHDSKMLSEFPEAIRAIYELLGGNVCVCEGRKNVPVEDRMDSFVISKKFGLDWRQSFGLRLWYAISQQDSAALAVLKFKDDVNQDKEDSPRPWYHEQGLRPLWDDVKEETRQDLLWGLLQLYADEKADLESILRPENSQLSPLDVRLSWQLGQALTCTGRVSFGERGEEKADAMTIAYAAQLTAAGDWLDAVFVLLHLRNSCSRVRAIKEHLCRHAGKIGPDSGATFAALTEKFQIPAAWVWTALALYMRSVRHDASAEVHCLLRAGEYVEAHRVLVQQVAPQAVIARDYSTLSSLLSQFQGRVGSMAEWTRGGEIYSQFLSLMQHRGKGETAPAVLLEKLLAGLNVMNESVGESEVVRYAAVSDMADETAREILKLARKKQDMELRSRILNLPLTHDRLLAYSIDLSMDQYREVMSH
ncbi:hypothetical protein E4U42_005020 [Claviceps africana]|uniref:Peptidase S59 domain-containing protein n=1 Tax=Claviceps africana TaxID=83212 RepID=A0A8K0NHN1_9HYPO|nr:hypothetical protein E4U42_005020 [Claviceps africana]